MPLHVHAAAAEPYAFLAQAAALQLGPRAGSERDAPARPDHAVPWNTPRLGAVEGPHRPAHGPRAAHLAEDPRHLAVGEHAAAGDAAHHRIDPGVEAQRGGFSSGFSGFSSLSGPVGATFSGAVWGDVTNSSSLAGCVSPLATGGLSGAGGSRIDVAGTLT